MSEKPRFGHLPPMYNFILNPHAETRVSTCPVCERKMHQRKVPLFIHVDPLYPLVLGYTCRYCPDCDLLVAHQDQIEALLANVFTERDPSLTGNDYLVIGTVERAFWRAGMKTPPDVAKLFDHLHDFKEVWSLKLRPAGWYRDEEIAAEEREIEQARAQFRARTGQGEGGEGVWGRGSVEEGGEGVWGRGSVEEGGESREQGGGSKEQGVGSKKARKRRRKRSKRR